MIQIFLARYNKYFPAGVRTPGAGSRRGTRTRCWITRPSTPAPSAGAAAHAARSTGSGQSGLKSHFVFWQTLALSILAIHANILIYPGPWVPTICWSQNIPSCHQHLLLLGMPISISPTGTKIANGELL